MKFQQIQYVQFGWRALCGGLTIAAILVGGGCVSAPSQEVVSRELDNAQMNVERAEEAGAEKYSPAELDMAREKLTQAEQAVENNELGKALFLTEKAALDARLAAAKARTEKNEKAAEEIEQSIQMLRREIHEQ